MNRTYEISISSFLTWQNLNNLLSCRYIKQLSTMKYFILALKNWNKFKGRANRSEFWYFTLFYFILAIITYFIDVSFLGYDPMDPTSLGVLQTAYILVLFIPSFSVTIRRLHDVNRSGWNLLWYITIIGIVYVTILNILKGTDGDNKYGAASNA